jgi:acetolactate synthase small subunit
MQTFRIRYRNTQGTLMRILNAASRRGLDLPYVAAEAGERGHEATLMLDVNSKQIGQLRREWYSIVDVIEVSSSAEAWAGHRPPGEVSMVDAALEQSRSAARA